MKIEFVPSLGQKGDPATKGIQRIFEALIPQEYLLLISDFLITESNNYAEVVNSVDPSAGVSNNSSAIGIAKTIYHPEINQSTIIIQNHQITPLLHGLNSGKLIAEWTVEQLDGLYTSIHEIGHAVDNSIRPDLEITKPTRPFKFEKVCEYYYQIITDEIGANLCATTYLPANFKIHGRVRLKNHIQTSYSELEDFRKNIARKTLVENECFYLIGQIAIILLKTQEVFMHRDQNDEQVADIFSKGVQIMIRKWLMQFELEYPNLNPSLNEFIKICDAILEYQNFKRVRFFGRERIKKCA